MLSLSQRRVLGFLALLASCAVASASEIHQNDVARYLAGMPPSPGSHTEALTDEPGWQLHARDLDAAWQRLESTQLAPVRAWSSTHLSTSNRTLLYMFGGPDYLYARNFFPHAGTYVLAGLEVPGVAPDLASMSAEERQRGFETLRVSLKSILHASFFITSDMQKDLHGQGFLGVLPVLYVFLARSGMEIRKVSHLRLRIDGGLEVLPAPRTNRPAVLKITFHDREQSTERDLYYFSIDLSNVSLENGAFLKFLDRQGPSDAFIKSASYLIHGANFSRIRNALLERSTRIVQDDTGVPLNDYDQALWQVTAFGRYTRPIAMFDHMFQPSLAQLFQEGQPAQLNFRLGYGTGVITTGILLAKRR